MADTRPRALLLPQSNGPQAPRIGTSHPAPPAETLDIQLDLRNGALRKKYDSLKYTLQKMEVGARGGGVFVYRFYFRCSQIGCSCSTYQ